MDITLTIAIQVDCSTDIFNAIKKIGAENKTTKVNPLNAAEIIATELINDFIEKRLVNIIKLLSHTFITSYFIILFM